jgi:tRNA threonylcarbamoyladenosine biosynthesis protein TsaE
MDPSGVAAPPAHALTSNSADETHELGRRLGEAAVPGLVVALIGELGAGKTQLTKGIADGLGVTSVVNSPTFVLMNEHVGRLRLFHVDAYRLGDPSEAAAAGLLDERQAEGVAVIEWADRLDGWLPTERLEIRLSTPPGTASERILHWRAEGKAARGVGEAALAAP